MFKLKFNLFSRIATATISILIIACAVSLVTLSIRGVRPELKQPILEKSDSVDSPAALKTTPDYGQFYVDSIIFLGDTTVSDMRTKGVLSDGEETRQIWTDADGHLPLASSIDKTEIAFPEGENDMYIADAAAQKRPQYLLITVGIENGVRYCTEEQFKAYYSKLITLIKESSPDTKIILNSIFPVSKKYEKQTQGISMDKIDTANAWIVEVAEEQGVKYLHSASALKGSNGYLDPKYDSGDGLHLSTDGYNAFFTYIRTHGYK